jgi:hypothetical protein
MMRRVSAVLIAAVGLLVGGIGFAHHYYAES